MSLEMKMTQNWRLSQKEDDPINEADTKNEDNPRNQEEQ